MLTSKSRLQPGATFRAPEIIFAAVCLVALMAAAPAARGNDGGPAPVPDRLAWWAEARFGLFVHWGPVSLKGTEIGWSRGGERRGYGSRGNQVPVEVYDQLYLEFNPTNFNAREWVGLAKAAGMKYLVFTSRHHDGFSMFDTKASDYRITSSRSPFHRDVVRELADASHEAGLRFGLYYSQPNWHHPDAFTPDRHSQYLDYLKTQVRELLTNYGQLDVLWYDGLGKSAKDYDAPALNALARQLQPGIIINNRNGLAEDFDTPEQRVGKYQDTRPWESCITMGRQWAWKPEDELKSARECLQTLVLCAGGDGNLLFNVGPMPDGRIEPRQVERLKEMGAWLKRNGESIYGTRGGPWKPSKALASTRRERSVFLHILRWDGDHVTLPALPREVLKASVAGGGAAGFRQADGKLTVQVPVAGRDPLITVVRLDLETSAMDLPPISQTPEILAKASNVYQNQTHEYGPDQAFDNDPATRWATDTGTSNAWISATFPRPLTIKRVRIEEARAYTGRVRKFALQSLQGETWKTIFEDEKIGRWFQREFPPVAAREVRLLILEAADGPTIADIEFFEQ